MLNHSSHDPFQDPTIQVEAPWDLTYGGPELNISNGLPTGGGYSPVGPVGELAFGVAELVTSPRFSSNHGNPGCCDAILLLDLRTRLAQTLPLAKLVVNSRDETLGEQRAALIVLGAVFSSAINEQSFEGFRDISLIREKAREVKEVLDTDLGRGEDSVLLSRLPYRGIESLPLELQGEDRYLQAFLGDMYSKALFFVALASDDRIQDLQLGDAFLKFAGKLQDASQVRLRNRGVDQMGDTELKAFLLRPEYGGLLNADGSPGQRVFDALLCAWEYAFRKGYALTSPFGA